MRPSGRKNSQLREIKFTHNYTKHAEGSVLVEFGDTKVLCNASTIKGVPKFLKDSKQGWLTAEYGMLPRSTNERMDREAARGKQSGRTQEIQRLIGRSLRAVINLKQIPDYTIRVDCDVIQADGGTRTAAITGASRAIIDAITCMQQQEKIPKSNNPIKAKIAAISVGIYKNEAIIDLDYMEDSNAQTDMNIVMDDNGGIIEVQGTAEEKPFTQEQFLEMLNLAKQGINEINSI